MSDTEALAGQVENGQVGQRQEQGRVVLRGVQVIVLDDLSDGEQRAIRGMTDEWNTGVYSQEAWIPEALKPGSFDAAIVAHAGESGEQGNRPGRYRAVRKGAWFEKGPRNIEPPLG
jgi:hypothetical protein